jgi:ABC-type thiamine transport system substrate-binding protein
MDTLKLISSFIMALVLVSCTDSDQPHSKVYKSDASIQCGSSGIEVDTMARELTDNGIDVVCAQKGHDGLVRITLCGEPTGNINIYTINTSNLPDAETLGFLPVSILSDYQDSNCND